MTRPIRLVRDSFPDRPPFDIAVSRAVLLRVADGELPETLRINRPGPMVAFGRQDVVTDGYPEAVRAARAHGFEAVERLAGGRAAVFHEQTIAFSWAIPDDAPREMIGHRFDELDDVIMAALTGLEVDARVGEIPGEYCPGTYSVNAGGRIKLMGVGQRLVSGGAHVGGVLVVDGAEDIREVLLPVYEALGLGWDPDTVGAVSEEVDADWEEVAEALIAAFGERFDLSKGNLDDESLELAEQLAPEHRSPG